MFEDQRMVKIYRVTVKKVMERLSELENVDIDNFKDEVIEQFDGYDFEDVEDLVGFDSWCDFSNDGEYELSVKIDHEDAYEFSIFIEVIDKKVTVKNVL